jgi:orotidine-5'-phosphate decarboxylase
MKKEAKDFLVVSLDVPSTEEALIIVEELGEMVNFYKVGLELFSREGPTVVEILKKREKRVFLDLKFHDIPNTISGAVNASIDMGVDMLTVHTLGGFEMMESAQKVVWNKGVDRPVILGVTILTSLDEAFLEDVLGIEKTLKDEVLDLASIAKSAGLGGVVASSEEISLIKGNCGRDFIVVTPGIRPKGTEKNDQKRANTPFEAIVNGSDYLVIGRPIIKASNIHKAAEAIVKEINNGLQKIA